MQQGKETSVTFSGTAVFDVYPYPITGVPGLGYSLPFARSTRWSIQFLRFCLTYTASARLSENRFETYSSTSMFLLFDWPELYAAGLNCQGANPENALAAQSIQDKHRSRAPGSS